MAWGELTADDLGIILDGVLIVVHIGVTAQVKELLVAAVMGMAAPRGRWKRAGDVARLGLSPTVRDPNSLYQFLTDQTCRLWPRGGNHTTEVTQPGRARPVPQFLAHDPASHLSP